MTKPLEKRFWEKVDIRSSNECWKWRGKTNPKGYGEFYSKIRNGKHTRSHQVSWILAFGDIPDGFQVCHTCDNSACVNPNHLFLGTNQDNVDDKMKKGRWKSRFLYGEEHPQHGEKSRFHKLTEQNVLEIRRLREQGHTLRSIGERFGVTHGVVNNILQGRKWAWLK